ncbi:tail protein X, partial [Serratia marcescens]|uniref:tail protein X n=1 Tax=Serratia marcescens TaxID=615 RepID=UPI000951AF43
MEVKALQGDTVDQLCYRYYGKTQGVTEAVLEANPGLCEGGPFLAAGQVIALPDI